MSDSYYIQGLIDTLAQEYEIEAIHSLVNCGEAAIEPLVAGLNRLDLDPYAHDTYSEALVSILLGTQNQRATDILVPLVEHENADVRRRAVSALGDLGDRRAIPVLRISLYDRNDSVQHATAYALIQLAYGTDLIQALSAALYDEDMHVRYVAVRSLEFLNADDLMLEAAINDEPRIRQIAVYYIGRAKVLDGFELLIDALQDPDDEICLGAIWSLGQLGNPRAMPALEQLINDVSENVARASREALIKLENAAQY